MNTLYVNSDRYKFVELLSKNSDYYIACIDIVNFKGINEKFGFIKGDSLLAEIIGFINYLSNNIVELNVCRYEKDVVMVMIKTKDEITVIDTINKIISNKYKHNITFKAGYQKIDNSQMLDYFLESILYVIKNKKYNVKDQINKDFRMNKDIEKYFAIKQDVLNNNSEHFNLLYQPKINNKTKEIQSCEVLSRWRHPIVGESNPDEFLSIIKHLDKELEFDLIIFEKACSEISKMNNIINKFSVNVSMNSISNKMFAKKIQEISKEYNIDSNNVTLEILEDVCENIYKLVNENITYLVSLGYKISIDDFGTGYSSYSRLAELDFSEVKIPREFLILENVKNIKKNKKILSGIVSLCKQLNYDIVLEGVETEENLNLAEMLNIDYVQGYYYSKPLSKEEYRKFTNEYINPF